MIGDVKSMSVLFLFSKNQRSKICKSLYKNKYDLHQKQKRGTAIYSSPQKSS